MSEDRYKLRCAVLTVIEKDGKFLLFRRVNTGWEDGKYGIPGGHFEANETILQAAVRETKEESDLDVKEEDLDLVHVSQRRSNHEYIDLFFNAKKWSGTPKITEENKSDDMIWVSIDELPENTLEFVKSFFEKLKKGENFSLFGI